jgi:hypothetical protein
MEPGASPPSAETKRSGSVMQPRHVHVDGTVGRLVSRPYNLIHDVTGSVPVSHAGREASCGSVCAQSWPLHALPRPGRRQIVGPIAASGAVVPVIVGLIEGDTLRPATAAGMVLAGVGTVCSSWNLRRAGVRRWPSTAAS